VGVLVLLKLSWSYSKARKLVGMLHRHFLAGLIQILLSSFTAHVDQNDLTLDMPANYGTLIQVKCIHLLETILNSPVKFANMGLQL